jgi:flagellin-like protein
MFKKMSKNDEGVSAVIGVILMVAITVILAAVIAAFVFGMVGGVQKQATPLFTVTQNGEDSITVTLQNANGASSITEFQLTEPSATVTGGVGYLLNGNTYVPAGADLNTKLAVGDVITITDTTAGTDAFKSPVSIEATADVDGSTSVVLDTSL